LKVNDILSKTGTSMSAAPILQTNAHVHNVPIHWWSCFVDNVSSRTNALSAINR